MGTSLPSLRGLPPYHLLVAQSVMASLPPKLISPLSVCTDSFLSPTPTSALPPNSDLMRSEVRSVMNLFDTQNELTLSSSIDTSSDYTSTISSDHSHMCLQPASCVNSTSLLPQFVVPASQIISILSHLSPTSQRDPSSLKAMLIHQPWFGTSVPNPTSFSPRLGFLPAKFLAIRGQPSRSQSVLWLNQPSSAAAESLSPRIPKQTEWRRREPTTTEAPVANGIRARK